MVLLSDIWAEVLLCGTSQHEIIFLMNGVANVTAADFFGISLIPFLFWIFIESKVRIDFLIHTSRSDQRLRP